MKIKHVQMWCFFEKCLHWTNSHNEVSLGQCKYQEMKAESLVFKNVLRNFILKTMQIIRRCICRLPRLRNAANLNRYKIFEIIKKTTIKITSDWEAALQNKVNQISPYSQNLC